MRRRVDAKGWRRTRRAIEAEVGRAQRGPVEGRCRVDAEGWMEGPLKDHVVLVCDGDDIVMEVGNTAVGRELGNGNETVWCKEWKNVGLGSHGRDIVEGKSGDSG